MTDASGTNTESNPSPEEEVDPTLESNNPWIMLGAIGLAIVIGVGAVGWLTGSGWFSYRTILYGSGELYAINLGDEPLDVTVDGRGPETIPSNGKGHFELIGGTSTVTVSEPNGDVLEQLSVTADHSDALVKASEAGCLAAVDISFLYNPHADRPNRMPIAARIVRDQRLYVPGTHHVVWPRDSIPTKLTDAETSTPKSIWIETVNCDLLADDNAHMLDTYLSVELQARLERSTQSRRQRPDPNRNSPSRKVK